MKTKKKKLPNLKNLSKSGLALLFLTIGFVLNLKSQDYSVWIKFDSSSDLPLCDGQMCTHPDQDFENYLNSLNVQRLSLALPAIVNFPQASNYGLDLVYEISVDSLIAESVIDSLSRYSFIEYAESGEEEIVPLYTPDDYNLLDGVHGPNWQLDLLEAQDAWSISGDANAISVGILEGGRIQGDHPDLMNLIVNASTSGVSYHKTHVAGCASASTDNGIGISSIGYNAKLYDGFGGTNGWLTAAAAGSDIMNMSYYSPSYCWSSPSTTQQNTINMLTDDGVIFVAAAGNGNIGNSCPDPNDYHYPASYDNVISVTSVGEDNNHFWASQGGQHTHNDKVDISTPGYDVLSTIPGGGFTRSSGTSMASPMTAGVIALLLNINPCLDHDDILSIIQSSADPVSDAANFPANSLGAGRINAYQACLAALQTTDLPNPVFTATQSTISNTVIVGQDMIIESGATLTITGTVKMSPGRKIIVKQNGTLIVDGGTITNSDCRDTFWHGIEVAGDTDQHQYSYSGGNYHQGRLILKNGALIENARNGARNMLGNDWGARGGIIQASNSTFLNCGRAVEFMSYQNFSPSNPSINRPDQSYFRECTFELNDDYLLDQDVQPPSPRITLWETDRVRISGCQFINTSTVSETEHRSIAVYSHDANYSITERCLDNPQQYGVCNNEVPSFFKGWYKAIEALETSSGRPIVVRKSIFEENMIGVEINGTSFSEIYQNDFLVGDHPFPEFANEPNDTRNHLGIHVIETTHYAVEENDIQKPSGATYEGNGVLVYNSKGAENAVYKNQFTDLQTGAESDHINRNTNYTGGVPAGLAGLQFLCNQNSGNKADFRISRTNNSDINSFEYINAGTRQDHGSDQPDRPAKNTFSSPDADPLNYVHFTVNSDFAYKYFYDSNPPSMSEITPGTFVAPILVANTQGCPSNYTTGIFELPTKHEFSESQGGFNGLLFTYQETIDDGNTPAMITEIDLAYPSEAWEMRNTLLARSPYNSEQVLIAAALREIMPHAMLLEVLLANPDALRSGNVIRVVSTQLSNPLPQYMIDMLYASRDQTTLRTIMETSLADLNFERQRIYKRLVNSKFFLEDQVDEPDSVIYYLSQVNTLESNIARAAAYSDRNQFSAANTLLDSMIVHFKLDQAQINELQALKTLYSLIASAESQGRSIAQLNTSEIASLTALADNDDAGLAQNKAQNALCFHYGICPVPVGTPKNSETPKPKPTKEELVEKLNTSAAYPNPATDFVTIEFELLFARENTRLSVFDPLGREVESRILGLNYQGQELFDTRNWGDGLYIYSITQDEELLETGKFTIVR